MQIAVDGCANFKCRIDPRMDDVRSGDGVVEGHGHAAGIYMDVRPLTRHVRVSRGLHFGNSQCELLRPGQVVTCYHLGLHVLSRQEHHQTSASPLKSSKSKHIYTAVQTH
jgi:hypothetical protein